VCRRCGNADQENPLVCIVFLKKNWKKIMEIIFKSLLTVGLVAAAALITPSILFFIGLLCTKIGNIINRNFNNMISDHKEYLVCMGIGALVIIAIFLSLGINIFIDTLTF
jgi:hypothetical protein